MATGLWSRLPGSPLGVISRPDGPGCGMSTLLPETDVNCRQFNVRFGPTRDVAPAYSITLLAGASSVPQLTARPGVSSESYD